MKDEELDRLIQRANSGRGASDAGPDVERVWKRINSTRARQNSLRRAARWAGMILTAGVVVVAGVSLVLQINPDLRRSGGSDIGGRSSAPGDIKLLPSHQDPTFELRTVVSAEQLAGVDASALLADDAGNVYVADQRTNRVIVFDSSGKQVLRIGPGGSAGAGASQSFGSIGALGWLGDTTIVVADNGAQALYLLSRDGQLLERRALQADIISVVQLYTAGERLFGAGASREAGRERRTYFRVSTNGSEDATLTLRDTLTIPATVTCTVTSTGAVHNLRAPFAPQGPLRAFDANGNLVVALRDNFAFRIYGASNGNLAGSIEERFAGRPVTDEKWLSETRELQTLQERFGQATCTPEVRRPASEPVIIAVVGDARGRLWVEANGASGHLLTIVDVAQGIIESTSMPQRDYQIIPMVSGNRILFVSRGPSGRPSISSYSKRY